MICTNRHVQNSTYKKTWHNTLQDDTHRVSTRQENATDASSPWAHETCSSIPRFLYDEIRMRLFEHEDDDVDDDDDADVADDDDDDEDGDEVQGTRQE